MKVITNHPRADEASRMPGGALKPEKKVQQVNN